MLYSQRIIGDDSRSVAQNCPNLEPPKMSFSRLIDKLIVDYLDNGILSHTTKK